jgi:hypothetical protein
MAIRETACHWMIRGVAGHGVELSMKGGPRWYHLRAGGFDIAVVKDATAAPRHPVWGDSYTAALINFTYLAKAVMTADEVIDAMHRGQKDGRPRGI